MFKRVLVTGAAGFIGFHTAGRLCAMGREVIGFDSVNDYYDVSLKDARLKELAKLPNFTFVKGDLSDAGAVSALFAGHKPDAVIHLAAQAGVRYSLENPRAYVSSNIDGFLNILEACRHNNIAHLLYASSSSVYGANTKLPYSVGDNVDHPVSLYAATKKSNELMAHAYAHLFRLPVTGLRFFTVYGPWGRPDMAYYSFTKAIYESRPIQIFNQGEMHRDFTYIDDIVESVVRLTDMPADPNAGWSGDDPDPASSLAPYRLYNIGNHSPVLLKDMVSILEEETGREAVKEYKPMQPGDVLATYADVDALKERVNFAPTTDLRTGLRRFIAWYRDYYGLGNGPEG